MKIRLDLPIGGTRGWKAELETAIKLLRTILAHYRREEGDPS